MSPNDASFCLDGFCKAPGWASYGTCVPYSHLGESCSDFRPCYGWRMVCDQATAVCKFRDDITTAE